MIKKKGLIKAGLLALGLTTFIGCMDDSEAPTLRVEQVEGALEGNEGTTALEIQLTRTGDLEKSSSIGIKTRESTAIAGEDFEAVDTKVGFAAGEESKTFTINVIADAIYEEDEYFFVDFSGSEDDGNIKISEETLKLVIVNDDAVPVLSFVTSEQVTSENNKDVKIDIKLSNPVQADIVIDYEVAGTAARNSDYTVDSPEKISIGSGEEGASISLTVLSDVIPEGGESIVLRLLSAQNADIGQQNKHVVVVSADTALNDTGFTTFSNESAFNLNSEPASHPGQDASFGSDIQSNPDFDGEKAFNFTKLDGDGNELSASAPNWSCVRDNNTGLVWEVKQHENPYTPGVKDDEETEEDETVEHSVQYPYAYRSKDFAYFWYSENNKNTGGSKGFQGYEIDDLVNPITAFCAFVPGEDEDGNKLVNRNYTLFCNMDVYVKEANKFALCGYQNWRVPTVGQLRDLANYQSNYSAMLDERYFPHNQAADYLSSNPSPEKDGSAYCFSFKEGRTKLCHKGSRNYLRLVVTGE